MRRLQPQRLRQLLGRYMFRPEAVAIMPLMLLLGVWVAGTAFLAAAAAGLSVLCLIAAGGTPPVVPGERDGASGLSLRPALEAVLDDLFSTSPRAGKSSIVFAIGIDDFAEIEARHGLHAAECVLRAVGQRIALALRGTDLVARLEGATFGAAFGPVARADLEAGIQTSARIQAAVRPPILVEGVRFHVTVSVGFCLSRRAPRPTGEAAIGAALAALAEAQATGAGAVRSFVPPRGPARPADSEADVLAALELGEIVPWFQPQVSTDTGAVSGLEALARWEHPSRGVLGPRDFLPALESSGQIGRLGEVMLYRSLEALKGWDASGVAVPTVGVNFSATELRDPHVADRVAWELDRFGLAPDRLTVEILETVVADAGDESIVRSIAALARLGCRIDLDDFGIGHASLAALKRFPVRRIKIDRSFVTGLDEDRDQQRMVAGIVSLAERLGLETLAEGVERVGENAMLAQLGCGHVQGFVIARPMPGEAATLWLRENLSRQAEIPALPRRAI